MSEERWPVPSSWQWASAGDFAKIIGGGTPSSKIDGNFAESGIPWITPADLTGYSESHISRGRRDLSEQGFAESGAQLIPAGSVLFSSRAPIGYCVIANNEVSTNQGFKSLVLDGEINPGYVRHYLLSAKEYAESKASGTTFMELSGARVAELAVPIAPLPEQRRIVAKVDGLTARTARARKELDRLPTLLVRYKQRLLALAFSGELTAGWRKNLGQAPKLGSGANALWETPSAWTWQRVDAVGKVGLGRQRSPNNHKGPDMRPYMRSANITWNGIDTSDVKEMNFDAKDFERFQLKYGDVLLNEGSGSAKEVGKPAIWRNEIPNCCYQNTILRVQPEKCSSEYLYWYFLLTALSERFVDSTKGINIQHISKDGLARYMVPVPSREEQAEIVRRIESAFGWLDRVAADHAAAARLLLKLDAAILAKAFRGDLVPQDPNDEPASLLLERIKAERAASPKVKRGRQPHKTRSSEDMRTMAKNLEQVLAEAGDWISAQDAFQQCGIGGAATTEEIEKFYAELRKLDKAGRLEAEPVNDDQGRKLHDRLRLKVG